MDATDTAVNILAGTRDLEKHAVTAGEAIVRTNVRNWKTLPNYATSGSEAILKLKGPAVPFDPNMYKPVIKTSIDGHRIKLDFGKLGVDGVVFYYRVRGTVGWTKLAYDTHPPYFDTTPSAVANVPEVREYQALGVVNDVEIGLASDIVSVTYPG